MSRPNSRQIDPNRTGICGFSAGGATAALTAIFGDERHYESIDDIDKLSSRPNFAMLNYFGGLIDQGQPRLREYIRVTSDRPPMFFVHAFDDHASIRNSLTAYRSADT